MYIRTWYMHVQFGPKLNVLLEPTRTGFSILLYVFRTSYPDPELRYHNANLIDPLGNLLKVRF